VQYLRANTAFVRGRALIASIDAAPGRRAALIARARRVVRRLERERMPWTAVLSSMVAAAAANAAGDRDAAVTHLESAVHRAGIADMSLHVWASRHRLGLLLGGPEGERIVRDAEEAMGGQGVRVPARYANMLLPGLWLAPQRDPKAPES
jgi:hypothetical protein